LLLVAALQLFEIGPFLSFVVMLGQRIHR
jgi:hypothetical protein